MPKRQQSTKAKKLQKLLKPEKLQKPGKKARKTNNKSNKTPSALICRNSTFQWFWPLWLCLYGAACAVTAVTLLATTTKATRGTRRDTCFEAMPQLLSDSVSSILHASKSPSWGGRLAVAGWFSIQTKVWLRQRSREGATTNRKAFSMWTSPSRKPPQSRDHCLSVKEFNDVKEKE